MPLSCIYVQPSRLHRAPFLPHLKEGVSRSYLDEHLGMVRSYDKLSIGNTTYMPPVDQPGKRPTISDHLDTVLAQAQTLQNPLDQSIYLFTRLPYLQGFRDCNKRTSRLAGNLPLLLAHEYPISFMGFEKSSYNRAMVAFYEFGDVELFKEGFVNAYVHSALKFHPLSRDASIFVQTDPSVVRSQIADYILTGASSKAVETVLSDAIRPARNRDSGGLEP